MQITHEGRRREIGPMSFLNDDFGDCLCDV